MALDSLTSSVGAGRWSTAPKVPGLNPRQVTALAGALRRPVYVVSLSSPAMGDEVLRGLLNSAAPRCVLLLEVRRPWC